MRFFRRKQLNETKHRSSYAAKRSAGYLLIAVFAMLAAPATVAAQAITHAYNTDTPIQRGMIVRLDEKDKTKVEPVSQNDIAKMEGVVVAANDAPLTLSTDASTSQQVFVATTGRYEVLVCNQNGPIKKDDYITLSALDGVGMKADGNQSRIIGRAVTDFDGKNDLSGQTTVKNSEGKDIPINIGVVGVDINISHNPLETKQESIVPGLDYLQKAAGSITNKSVAPAQVYLSLVAFLVAAGIAGSILYAGVRTSMVAIGRNPLAKGSVMRNLISVVITSVIILIIGVTAVYLILKL